MRGVLGSWVILLLVTSFAIGISGLRFVHFAGAETSVTNLPQLSLMVVNDGGGQVVLDENNITDWGTTSGYGGFINQLNNVKGWGNYTGVSLNTLCNLVGGLTNKNNVTVIGSDGYNATLTYDEVVNGNFTTYDRYTKTKVSHNQPLVPIVAYYVNGTNLDSNHGPLRLAIVGPEEKLVTSSTYWVYKLVKVEIVNDTVPEYPSPIVLSLLLFATSAVAFALKPLGRRHLSAKRFCGLTGECGQ